ncbi:MAG: hypothetical protein IPL61_29535 [Myxococcales bacterium]|nr:hypothetical protein [Myxococcales bacterium]
MIGSKWKMVAAAASMATLAALAAPRLAAAQDNAGGGPGDCHACTANYLTGSSQCVTYGTGYSNLFGMTVCTAGTERLGFKVLATCELSGQVCMGDVPLPPFPGYL